MGGHSEVDKTHEVGALVGNIISPALVVISVSVSSVEDLEQVTAEEAGLSGDGAEESHGGIVTGRAGAFVHEVGEVNGLEARAFLVQVSGVLFGGLLDLELVVGVLRVADILLRGVEHLLEVVLHVGLQGFDLVLDVLDGGKDQIGVRGLEKISKSGNVTNDSEEGVDCLEDLKFGGESISDLEDVFSQGQGFRHTFHGVRGLVGLVESGCAVSGGSIGSSGERTGDEGLHSRYFFLFNISLFTLFN